MASLYMAYVPRETFARESVPRETISQGTRKKSSTDGFLFDVPRETLLRIMLRTRSDSFDFKRE